MEIIRRRVGELVAGSKVCGRLTGTEVQYSILEVTFGGRVRGTCGGD